MLVAPGEVDTFHGFTKEGLLHAANAVGCVVLGDLYVHHRKWLKYSNRNSLEGQELCAVCKELGLTQPVREPRGGHLLVLVLSIFLGVKAGVLPLIADHKPEPATLKLSVPSQVVAERKVWSFRDADWERLQDSLDESDAAQWITDSILRSARSCIPLTTLRSRKSSHPWLNDRSVALIDAKRAAERTPLEKETTPACSAGLAAAHLDYTARTAQKMRVVSGQLPSCGGRRQRKL